jgi:hypothetical protein
MHSLGGYGEGEETSDVLTSFQFSVVGREINERIGAVTPFVSKRRKLSLVCECGDADCEAVVEVTPQQYQEVRTNLKTFLVAPGHLSPESDRVLKSGRQWMLVEKVVHYGQFETRAAPTIAEAANDGEQGDDLRPPFASTS